MYVNPMLACDFYKVGHVFQYPKNTEYVYSNLTPRSFRLANKQVKEAVVFGLQGFIKWFLIDTFNRDFFNRPKDQVVAEYKRVVDGCLVQDTDVSHIAALHDLGYLPIRIKALPEGSVVPAKIPVLTVINTKPEFYWLTNYIESILSAELWKPMNTASTAYAYRKLLTHYAANTGSPLDFVLWQGHDFSFRGVGGVHDAANSGSGHLVSFLGTDTIPAINYIEQYYNGMNTFVGGSVPATEHSVMSAGGKEDEIETFRRIIQDVHPTGVVSVVSDTWDFWKVITEYAAELKPVIMNRKPNAIGLAKTVFRPDSGDPVEILCGIEIEEVEDIEEAREILVEQEAEETPHGECGSQVVDGIFKLQDKYVKVTVNIDWNRYDKQYYYIDGSHIKTVQVIELTPAQKGAVECLWDIFGGTITETSHKLLDSHVGLIYGDSITLDRAHAIMSRLAKKGFASGNVVFGIGSYTYQYATRDTLGLAMKATWAVVDGEERELFKDPVTDSGVKKSAKGLLRVEYDNQNGWQLFDQQRTDQEPYGELQTVFLDGKLVNETTIDEIRARINESLK